MLPLDLVINGGLQFSAPLLGLSPVNRNDIINFRKNQKQPKNSIYKLCYVFVKDIRTETEKMVFLFIYIMDLNYGHVSIISIILMYHFCFLVFFGVCIARRSWKEVEVGSC